jgi:hypothetical protein
VDKQSIILVKKIKQKNTPIKIILPLFIFLFSSLSSASSTVSSGQYSIAVENPPQNINLGLWDGFSDITFNNGMCVTSKRKNQTTSFFQRVSGTSGDNGNLFILENTSTGEQIPFKIEKYDPLTSVYSDVTPNSIQKVSDDSIGDCSSYGQSPYEHRVSILQVDMDLVSPGEYTTTIEIDTRARSNRTRPEVYDSYTISINIPYQIQVNMLDDILLGTYSGTGDLSGDEIFCIYTHGENYSLNISDDSVTNGFYLHNDVDINDQIPIEFLITMTNFLPTYYYINEGATYNGLLGDEKINCTGGQEVLTRVNILESDILAAKYGGDYRSIFTIIVSPQ